MGQYHDGLHNVGATTTPTYIRFKIWYCRIVIAIITYNKAMLVSTVFHLVAAATMVAGKQVSGVFTEILSLVFKGGTDNVAAPMTPSWYVGMNWVIDGSAVSAGDTFTLNLPCVFKFTTPAKTKSINLAAGGQVYATCNLYSGEVITSFSQLQCVASDTLDHNVNVSGNVNFLIAFASV